MSTEEENEVIRREFRRRNRRGLCQVLADIEAKLRRKSGWAPTLEHIAWRAQAMGLDLRWGGER